MRKLREAIYALQRACAAEGYQLRGMRVAGGPVVDVTDHISLREVEITAPRSFVDKLCPPLRSAEGDDS